MHRMLIAFGLTATLAGSAFAPHAGAQIPGPSDSFVSKNPCMGQNATHVGGPGPDVIVGSPGPDVIVGLGGNDTIYGLRGNDRICGGAGSDRIVGGYGNDVISGDAGNDRMSGEQGNDRLLGRLGTDHHDCGVGFDAANGGPPAFGDTQVACEVISNIP